jgi:hypothetical protein
MFHFHQPSLGSHQQPSAIGAQTSSDTTSAPFRVPQHTTSAISITAHELQGENCTI